MTSEFETNKTEAPQRRSMPSYKSATVWDLSLCAARPTRTGWHTQDTKFTPTPRHWGQKLAAEPGSHTLFSSVKVRGLKLCFPCCHHLILYINNLFMYICTEQLGFVFFLQSQILPLKGSLCSFVLYVIIPAVDFKRCFHLPQMSLLML